MIRLHKIAVLIPAFQAQGTIGEVVRRAREVLLDVLIVDDGSSDGTGEAARALHARVLTHPENRGKGSALRTGFHTLLREGFDAVVTLDADGQHLPEEIPKLVRAAHAGADLVLGTREQVYTEMSGVRRLGNQISSRLISFAAGALLPDIQTGFRLYGRRLLEQVPMPEDRFDAESAIVVRAARRGFQIGCVPVRLGFADGRSTSHYRPLVDSARIARSVIAARFGSLS